MAELDVKIGMEIELKKYGKVKIIDKDKNNCFFIKNQHGFEGWLHYGEILDYYFTNDKNYS